jgi:hypothetical protein
MIVYNVTVKVDHSIAGEWLSWLKNEHIPEMVATGCFTHAVILRLLDTDDSEGPTYAVQYHVKNKNDYNRYIEQHALLMQKKSFDRWGNHFIAFRTLMQVVQ